MSDALRQAIEAAAPSLDLDLGGAGRPLSLVRVAPGQFDMGSPPGEPGRYASEGPQHRVTLTRPFYLARFPLTQGQYTALTGRAPARPATPDTAIDQLTHADALGVCAMLAKLFGWPARLPSEAEWEYACRAGTRGAYGAGDTESDLARVAWYRANAGGRAREVGLLAPNAWGFHDMLGNVCEFCLDTLPAYTDAPLTDPVGAQGPGQSMMRGGGWMHGPEMCRAAMRLPGSDMFGGAGLRVLLPASAG